MLAQSPKCKLTLYSVFHNFSSSDKFVTVAKGSVTLFKGTTMMKSEVVEPTADKGVPTTVAYYNNQVVVGEDNGNLRIMSEDLKTIKILTGSFHSPRSILENADYYNRITETEPMVSAFR